MSAGSSSPTRRTFLATLTAAGAFGLVLLAAPCDAQTATEKETTVAQSETTTAAVRPFRINVPEEALVDLRRRIAATRWPDRETVTDRSQGVQLAKLQELVRYWGTDYDWRQGGGEAECLAAVRDDDRRARHPLHSRALSSSECPAADHDPWLAGLGLRAPQGHWSAHRSHRPTAGARRTPSISCCPRCPATASRPSRQSTGWGPDRIARAWDVLMKRLGYTRYVSQGRRLGLGRRGRDGASGAGGAAGHPRQHAGDRAAGHRQGAQQWRAGPGRALPRGDRPRTSTWMLCTRRDPAMPS